MGTPQHLKLLLKVPRITHKRKSLIIIDDHTAGDGLAFLEGAFLEGRGRWYEAKGGHNSGLFPIWSMVAVLSDPNPDVDGYAHIRDRPGVSLRFRSSEA